MVPLLTNPCHTGARACASASPFSYLRPQSTTYSRRWALAKELVVKITKVETIQIETPRYYGHISGHVLVKVFVDDGPVGWGEASDSRAEDLAAIARQYNELLVGRDAGPLPRSTSCCSATLSTVQ